MEIDSKAQTTKASVLERFGVICEFIVDEMLRNRSSLCFVGLKLKHQIR
jgi:hypothetical protein